MLRIILLSVLVAFGMASCLPYAIPTPQLSGSIPDQPFEDSVFRRFDGTRLHWRERSPAQAKALLILLHGFGGSGFSWRHSLEALEAAGYQVIAPDLPPFGYSERRSSGPDWPDLVIQLAEARGSDLPWVLVGHSMGVSVASEVTNRRPDRVAGLIMVGGTPQMRQRGNRWSWTFWYPPVGRWTEIWAANNLVDDASIERMLSSAFGRAPTKAEFEGYYQPLIVPGTYPALIRRLSARGAVSDDWVARPHAIIWGEFDRWVPMARAERLIDRLQRPLAIQVIPEAGHNPMDTHPDAFDALLLEQVALLLDSATNQLNRSPLRPDS